MDLNVYAYKDYRKLLSDFYYDQKKKRASYSYKAFADRAGLNSPNYLKLVMDGKRNLSHKNIKKFAKGLGLESVQVEYFENLVYYNQAQDAETRDLYLTKLKGLNMGPDSCELTIEQKDYLNRWYFVAIREMAALSDFKWNPEWIVARLNKEITAQEARESLDLLLKLALISKENDSAKPINRNIFVDEDFVQKSQTINKFHRAMGEQALDNLKSDNYRDRAFHGITASIGKRNFHLISEKIKNFRADLNRCLSAEENPDEVYQLNIQFFPLTRVRRDD
ncbi:MAG: TIGR02147 family protein [Deltaproteobacteria bacterium]|nr:TIGR02147 family protein [Deltaproteobacteria bacterium]